jgi:hypothetical protein
MKNNKHWSAYAAATGAALALSTNADAEIYFSGPVDLIVSAGSTKALPLHTAGSAELRVLHINSIAAQEQDWSVRFFTGRGRGNGMRFLGSGGYMRQYAFGQAIGGQVTNPGTVRKVVGPSSGAATSTRGAFGPGPVDGFVGVKLSGDRLGWIQIKVTPNSGGYPDQVEVIDFAYNETGGGPIDAGQTSDNTSATPEPGMAALGLLASGAVGLLALRRNRRQPSRDCEGAHGPSAHR